MNTIKFNATDIDSKQIYCFFRDISENKKNTGIERIFDYDSFIEKETKLKDMLEGDVYSIFLDDTYTEKKYLDGRWTALDDDEISYIKEIVKKACVNLEYDTLLVSTIDIQIDNFIKEFFEEQPLNNEIIDNTKKDFLSEFFNELDSKNEETLVEDKKDLLEDFFKELENNEKIQTNNN